MLPIGIGWLCIISQWSFATGDVIQIWNECLAWIFLNQCFNHTQKSTQDLG